MNTIHLTDTRTFRHCRRAFKYSNIDRLVKVGDGESTPLTIGSEGHKQLNRLYSGLEPDYTDAVVDGEGLAMVQFLVDTYRQDVMTKDLANWQVATNEQVLEVEVDGTTVRFTLDLLVMEKYYWGVDHKFLARFPDQRNLDIDDQMTGYIWLLREKEIHVRGFLYNVLLKKYLSAPNILQKGGVSRAASTLDGTTAEMYREAIRLTGGVEEAYVTELDYLDKRDHPLFRRYTIVRSQKELDNYGDNLRAQLAEMKNPSTVYYPNPHFNCYQCSYQELCKCENEGSDMGSYIGTVYRRKEDGER